MSKQTAKNATAKAINAFAAGGGKTTEVEVPVAGTKKEGPVATSSGLKPGDVVSVTPPAPAATFDGIPSKESQVKRAEGLGVVKRTNAYFIDPKMITRRAGWNPRFDMGEVDQLAKSLKANGMLNPIRVKRLTVNRENQFAFELIDGDRRFTAIELLTKKGDLFKAFPEGIPAIIVDKAQDDLTSLFQMFEANSGKAFLPLEEAAAYQRMREAGLSLKKICAGVSRSAMHVTTTLALLSADDDVKEALKSGSIGKTMAKQIAKHAKGDKGKQKELVAAAKSAKGDKGKKGAVKKAIDTSRRAKAASKGRTLKIRALDDAELSAIGASVAATMADKMAAADLPLDSDMREWMAGNPDLALAFTFGALEALKVAAGADLNLSI